ncbi:MAG TPA: hypothetical protein VG148_00770 [Pyrinomonadaceae bacterium]|nr:hypothetical protein [Pyrinomonadaceae bacterium]
MLLITLLVIFWVVTPGLLTGWMLREHGRSFWWGLLPGALLGPAGILAALGFLFVSGRGARRRASGQSRRFRPFYKVPLVGRLHVSTAWSLAGVVAFLCAWMVGGLGYEFYMVNQRPEEIEGGPGVEAEANPAAAALGGVKPNRLQAAPKEAPAAASNSAAPTAGGPLLSGLAAQTGQAAQAPGRLENSPAQANQTLSVSAAGLAEGLTPPAVAAQPSAAPPAEGTPPPTPERAPAPSREAAVAEVTRGLSSEGHRVHVAISGDAQTTTLSVSGPTLTRQAGNQLLGRARQTLKGAGIRIVVMINGQESWTYIL